MSKLKLLDPTQLSDVELRFQVLGTKLDKLQKMKGSAQEADKQSKVSGDNIWLVSCVFQISQGSSYHLSRNNYLAAHIIYLATTFWQLISFISQQLFGSSYHLSRNNFLAAHIIYLATTFWQLISSVSQQLFGSSYHLSRNNFLAAHIIYHHNNFLFLKLGKHTFSVTAPKIWNEHTITLKLPETIATFHQTRTPFKIAFPNSLALPCPVDDAPV